MKTFVISLPEATGRQDHMRQQLTAQGITDFEFFTAVDGREFDVPSHPIYNASKRRKYFGRDLKGGELGVLLSHKSIYETMAANNTPIALIFEDDAILEPDFKTVLRAIETGEHDFDLVRFLGSKKVARLQQYTKRSIVDGYTLNGLRTTPGGAFAYIITLSGAKKMLAILQRIHLPIDTLMGHNWKNNLKAYIVQPGLAEQDEQQEQYIGTQRFKKELDITGVMRLFFPLTRAWFKLSEGCMKALWYWKNLLTDNKA